MDNNVKNNAPISTTTSTEVSTVAELPDTYDEQAVEMVASLKVRVAELEDSLKKQIAVKEELENKIQIKEEDIQKRTEEVEKKESELLSREKDVKFKESLLGDRERAFEAKEKKFGDDSIKKSKELVAKEEGIIAREQKISEKEAIIEEELSQKKISLSTELADKKSDFEKELAREKEKHMEAINAEIAVLRAEFEKSIDQERRTRYQQLDDSISKERTERLAAIEKEISAKISTINQELESLEKEKNALYAKIEDVEQEKASNELQKRRNERKAQQLDVQESSIDDLIMSRYEVKIKSFTTKIHILENECNALREQLKQAMEENAKLQTIKAAYGEEPSILLKKIEDLQASNEQLEREIAARPSKELHAEFESVKRENEQLVVDVKNLKEENKTLLKYQEENDDLKIENRLAQDKIANLESEVEELQNECETLRARISRLSVAEGRVCDREERIKEIKSGFIKDMFCPAVPDVTDEIKWLESIDNSCKNYGIAFPKRILYAFHTALKIADWSSVTVLAGVSGTGKSELPRLYSAFGGLNFINVPVQPNWDSQESMLGFFNSIDNRFDAQPLLRFLVECTEDEKYSEYMSIVLLDEMNLAHVEHYFADFLSKLESRRGANKDMVPTVEVKLGAGVEPYQLKLARTVLWTGTMNQDETTKSLSDKVLDRGIVINFPRPRRLSSRNNMLSITKAVKDSNRPMLKKSVWSSWIVRDISFTDVQKEEIAKYRKLVEDINDALEIVGRALGHRVWQSIEYYIANYPLVSAALKAANGELTNELKEAMRIAFEDQIVQKIMPKLRGIETRGKGGERLKKIEDILEMNGFEKLKDDFEIACEQGYGQFMWSSAKYIEADEQEMNISSENVESETDEEN